ncbi:MAG: PfkB family carbohydrate kinase [Planctomycetota bacterium]|nr:PfkB family carbohydrate kinase [Planctomycetota bacterium]
MSLLAVGTIAFDSIETPTDSRHRILGGSATYFGYAASFFTPVRLVGIVGKDWPDCYSQLLTDRGIDLSGVVRDEVKNSYFWHGRYTLDFQDRETLACEVQGFDQFVPKLPDHFRDSRFVFLGAASPSVQLKTLEQCNGPEFVFADTVDMWIERSSDELTQLLRRLNCLLINDSEARQFTRHRDLIQAGKAIQKMGPKMVIIKKGEHGCLLFHGDTVSPCPAYPTDSMIDPTGAGDSFAGGILGYLVNRPAIDRRTMIDAIHYGTVVASYTVAGFSLEGIQTIGMAEIEDRRSEFRKMLLVE